MKNKIQSICVVFIIFFSLQAFAQDNLLSDSSIIAYSENENASFISSLHSVINANRGISYFSVLPVFNPVERILPLKSGEGLDGNLFEGNLDMCFSVFKGKRSTNYFWQTTNLSFRYKPSIRLAFDFSDNYLLPTNQKIGGQIEKVLWENYTNRNVFTRRKLTYDKNDLLKWEGSKIPLNIISVTICGMHYSNGLVLQNIFSDSTKMRNNYQSGYFSTNYIQTMFMFSRLTDKLLSAGVGYQFDVQSIPAQLNRYGEHRILLQLQSVSKPRTAWFNLIPSLRSLKITDSKSNRQFVFKRLWQHRARLESEYIIGNLSNFNRSSDYRFAIHLYYEILPLRSKSVGFMIHAYYGRDYLNIRYDDVVYAVMGGVTLSLDKLIMPRFNANKYLVK